MNIGASGGGSGKYWCAFGVAQQQWGYYVESQNPTDYRYWSIPFTSHYITMATKTYYEPKEEAVPWLVGIDMQKFICGYGANFIGSSYVSCVGIGCQLQWGNGSSSSFSKKDYATPKDIGTVTISTPISMSTLYQGFICASSTSGPSLFVGFVTAYSGNSLTVRLITSLDSESGGSLVPNYILLGH